MSVDESEEMEEKTGLSKFIPILVLLATLSGFIGLSWYAYNAGRNSISEEDLIVIEAEKTPVKEKPLDPGGMKFPNQDKTIFETFSNNQQQPKVERVLPKPEEPISKDEVEKSIKENKEKRIVFDDSKEKLILRKVDPYKVEAKHDKEENSDVAADEDAPSDSDSPAQTISEKKPEKEEVKPAPKVEEKNKVEEKKPEKASEEKVEKPTATGKSNAKIQLGAYASEKEAQDNWKKIQGKFSSLNGKSPIIVKADITGKGTFYRLRVGASDKAEAKDICAILSSKKQACILVGE